MKNTPQALCRHGRFTPNNVSSYAFKGVMYTDSGHGATTRNMVRPYESRNGMTLKRKTVFERDEYACRYCGGEAEVVDHIIPWSFRHDDSDENLAASCILCNAFVSNKIFPSFDKKRAYIRERRFGGSRNKVLTIWLKHEIETLGKNLRKKIEPNVIIAENFECVDSIKKRLVDAGFKVRFR